MKPSRIDQAISPGRLIKGAVCWSMFIADDGLYIVKTGRGWRLNFDLGIGTRSVADNVAKVWAAKSSAVEAQLDVAHLAAEVAARKGSVFIAAKKLSDVALGSRRDGLPDLRFSGGGERYRVQFDNDRREEVEAFVAGLSELGDCRSGEVVDDKPDEPTTLVFEGTTIEIAKLPSPCWGATPSVSVNDGRLFVEYVAPTALSSVDVSRVYCATVEEQALHDTGDLALPELCQRLMFEAWGSVPPLTDGP